MLHILMNITSTFGPIMGHFQILENMQRSQYLRKRRITEAAMVFELLLGTSMFFLDMRAEGMARSKGFCALVAI